MPAPATARAHLDARSPLPAALLPYGAALAHGRRLLIASLGEALSGDLSVVDPAQIDEALQAFEQDADRTRHHAALLERALDLDTALGSGAGGRLSAAWRSALGRLQEVVLAGHAAQPTAGFQLLARGHRVLLRDAALLGLVAREAAWVRIAARPAPAAPPLPAPPMGELLSQLPLALLQVVGGRIRTANPHALRLLGLSDATRLAGTPLVRHLTADTGAEAELALRRVAQGGASGEAMYWWFRRACGAPVPAEVRALPMMVDGVDGVLLIGQDLSAIARDRARSVAADRRAAMGLVATGVVHEVGNPLTVLSLALQELSAEVPPDTPAAGLLDEARDAATRIRRIVRAVRVLARPDGEPGPLPVERVLERALHLAWPRLRGRARLVKDYAAAPEALACEGGLTRVVLNLLDNAAQAIDGVPGPHEVRVSVRASEGGVEVWVADTGAGPPTGAGLRAYAPFAGARTGGAAGVELDIARSVVEGWGGRLRLEAGPERGSVARLWLPAAPAEPSASAVRGRVLLLEPDEAAAAPLLAALAAEHDVVRLRTTTELRAEVGRSGVDTDALVLALPRGGDLGPDVAWLRRDHPDLARRLVFLVPRGEAAAAERLGAAAPSLFLPRPVDVAALQRFVDTMLALGARSGVG